MPLNHNGSFIQNVAGHVFQIYNKTSDNGRSTGLPNVNSRSSMWAISNMFVHTTYCLFVLLELRILPKHNQTYNSVFYLYREEFLMATYNPTNDIFIRYDSILELIETRFALRGKIRLKHFRFKALRRLSRIGIFFYLDQ